jgi:hypothetical protein
MGISVIVHLGLPRQGFCWSVFILVAFDMKTSKLDGQAIEDVNNTALHIVFRGEAIVRIRPGAVHGEVDAFDETLIVAVEQGFNGSGSLNEKEVEAQIEEKEDRKHAVWFSAERARIQAEGGSHAGPENDLVDCEFPSEGAKVAFSTSIADKEQFEWFTALEQLFESVGLVVRV